LSFSNSFHQRVLRQPAKGDSSNYRNCENVFQFDKLLCSAMTFNIKSRGSII